MDFLIWHYTVGLRFYLRRWFYTVGWVVHFFSLPLLLTSLFSPYRRLVDTEHIVGVNIQVWFRQFTFNAISRVIGAVVRLALFVFGTLLLLPTFFVGLIGLVFWLLLPPIGLAYYLFRDPHAERYLSNLVRDIKRSPTIAVQLALESSPGKFMLSHLNLSPGDLLPSPTAPTPDTSKLTPTTFAAIVHSLLDSQVWSKQTLRQHQVEFSDILLAAHWWDRLHHSGESLNAKNIYGRPGIGLSLLFGYTPTLDKYGTDLTISQSFAAHLIARTDLVSRMERSLTTGRSVLLLGDSGVGKKTIVLEFAQKCLTGELGRKMAYKRVVELDYNFLLAKNLDFNQKKNSLSDLLQEAITAGNIILVIKDLHRLIHPDVEGLDFTDVFEKFFETGKLHLIVIAEPVSYERFLATNTRLRKFMDTIEAVTPTADQATEILISFAIMAETTKKILITTPSLRAIITGSDKYISDTPFPEKALELLDHAIAFVDKQAKQIVTPDDVNQVLAERTGISMARLTENEKSKLADLETILHKRLIGQDAAITLISKSLRARAVGVKSDARPLGSFLFLGPTGVGKTETAKALADLYFGDDSAILRFDMAEFAGPEGLTRLIGSVARNQPGLLSTSIKNRPASLLLLDELEKAPSEVLNIFLSLLDEGSLTDAFGAKINCRHLFIIATSNAGSAYIRELVNTNTPETELSKLVVDYIQKQGLFSPEFLNRFDGVVVYQPLSRDQLLQIARIQLAGLVAMLDKQSISLKLAESAITLVAELGFEPEFGARPMRRLIDIEIGDLIGKAILKADITPGDSIELIGENKVFTYQKI